MFKAIDVIKAAGVTILLMAINVAVAIGVVAIYAYVIEPGHDNAFYEAAALDISPWSSVFAGAPIFFAGLYLFTKWRPQRDAIKFAIAVVAIYTMLDLIMLASEGALQSLAFIAALSWVTKLVAALMGAKMASKQ